MASFGPVEVGDFRVAKKKNNLKKVRTRKKHRGKGPPGLQASGNVVGGSMQQQQQQQQQQYTSSLCRRYGVRYVMSRYDGGYVVVATSSSLRSHR